MSPTGGFVSYCIVLYRLYRRGPGASRIIFGRYSPPALGERRHRGLARLPARVIEPVSFLR
jgi:hypothetical protein